jgi:hypothetical protein
MKKALILAFILSTFLISNQLQAQSYNSCSCLCGWGYTNTGANHTIGLTSTVVTLDGTAIVGNGTTQNVYLGVFYDSLGTLKNGGFTLWTGAAGAITAWGTESGLNNGFANNELFKWKMCVVNLTNSTSVTYDCQVTYMTMMPNTSNYSTNGISNVLTINAISAIGIEAMEWLAPLDGCGLDNAETVQVKFKNDQAGNIAQNILVSYSINGGTPVTETYTGGLLAGQVVTYTFSQLANFSAIGTYSVSFSVQLASGNDTDPTDNTLATTVANQTPPVVSFTANMTQFPTYPNFCYFTGLAPITLTGMPTGGTFTGDGMQGNIFIPDIAKGLCPTCTSFVVCYDFYDPITDCTGSYCDTIFLNQIPSSSITNTDLDLCQYDTVMVVGAPAGGVFTDNFGVVSPSTGFFAPQTAGNYIMTYTYTNPVTGCFKVSNPKTFVTHALPTAGIAALERAYCSDGADVTLSGTPAGGTFTSPTGAVFQGNVFKPSQTSVLTHTIKYAYTDSWGCFDDYSVTVKVFNGNPTINYTGLNPAYCVFDPAVTLTPVHPITPAITQWTGATNGVFDPNTIGTKTVTLKGFWNNAYFGDTAVCDNQVTKTTIVYALPQINLAANFNLSNIGSIETAEPDTIVMTAGPGYQYEWSTGQSSMTITTTGYGVYMVTITDIHGCKNSDTLAITGTDLAVIELESPVSNCQFIDPCSIPVTVKVTNPGTYTFKKFDKISFTGKINNNLVQSQTIELGVNTTIQQIAPGDTVLFTFNNQLPGCSTLVNVGTYTYRIVGKFMPNTTIFQLPDVKSSNDTLVALVENGGLPIVDLGADITTASPDTITLNAGPGFVSYLWTSGAPGAVDQTIQVPYFNGSDEFCVTVVDRFGCETSDCITIFNGIDDLGASYASFNIYPNPSNGQFRVEIGNLSNKEVVFEILDVQGKIVHQAKSNQTSQFVQEFDLKHLPKGLYNVRVFNGVDLISSHILIQ